MRKMPMFAAAWILALLALPTGAAAQGGDGEWCDDWHSDRDREWACEVREYSLSASRLDVDAGMNGGVEVHGESRGDIVVLARVQAQARSQARADEILSEVAVLVGDGQVTSDGPDTRRRESWSVSFRIAVPHQTDLDLETHNGGIDLEDIDGQVRFEALNGGIHLREMSGDVRGETVNGGLHVDLDGSSWNGSGLDVRTTNGGITLSVPDGYSAELETGTVNGGFDIDFPITVTGRIGRELRTQLGDGGPPVRVRTTNGGVRIARR